MKSKFTILTASNAFAHALCKVITLFRFFAPTSKCLWPSLSTLTASPIESDVSTRALNPLSTIRFHLSFSSSDLSRCSSHFWKLGSHVHWYCRCLGSGFVPQILIELLEKIRGNKNIHIVAKLEIRFRLRDIHLLFRRIVSKR